MPTKRKQSVRISPTRKYKNCDHDAGTTLSERQLEYIGLHKYCSEGTTLLDPIFQKFWIWVVEFVPLNVAPNLLTILGFVCNIIPSLILFITSNGAKEESPRIIYILLAAGLFIYQTLDAIDGKQARRTNTSSPLGELFDHGCDAVSCVFIALVALVLVQGGNEPWLMFFTFFTALAAYYFAHWQTYVTGKLRFGYIDVTEAQIALILIMIASSVLQTSVWNFEVGAGDVSITPRAVFIACMIFGCLRSALDNVSVISQGGIGIHGSSVANSSIVSPLFQYLLIIIMAYTISQKSNSELFENNPILYLFMFGLVWCKYTDILIVATMARSRIYTIDSILIGPSMLLLNQYLGYIVAEHIVLYIACVYCLFDLLKYNIRICNEICYHLNINCFTIKAK